MFEHVDSNTWNTLREKHPAAYNLLNAAEIKGEYNALKKELNDPNLEKVRYQWIIERLNDIEIWCPHLTGHTLTF